MGKKNKGGKIDATRLIMGGYDRELERYGVEGYRMGGKAQEMTGQSYRGAEEVEKDVINAARNDYDLRRTLEAAAMSGKGKANKILDKGFKNIGDVTNAANFSEKAAKRHGQGGAFDSASDYMGLTQSMVERDRRKHDESIEAMIDDKLADFEMPETPGVEEESTEVTFSPETQAAKERVEAYDQANRDGGLDIYGPGANRDYDTGAGDDEQDTTSVTPDSHANAQSYMHDYINKIKNRTM